MAQEFPSRINASGRVNSTGVGNQERGATTTRLGAGSYLITLERGLGVGWGVCLLTPDGAASIGAPIVQSCDQLTADTFAVSWSDSQAGQSIDQGFFYTIVAIDETE